MTDYLKKGLLGIILVFSATTLANFTGYLTRVVLARNISPEEVGLFYSSHTLVTLFLLISTLGLHSSIIKYIAEFNSQKKLSQLRFAFKYVRNYRLALGIAGAIIFFISSPFLAEKFFKSAIAEPVLKILSVSIVFVVISAIISSLFQGFQDMKNLALITFSEKFMFFLFTVAFIYFNFQIGALIPAYAFLSGIVLTTVLFLPLSLSYRKFWSKEQKEHIDNKKEIIKKITGFGFAAFMISLGNMIIGYIDTIILTYFRPLDEVGIYNIVLPTVIIIGFMSRSISQVFFPMVSELWTKNLKQKLNEGIHLLHNYSLIIVIPMAMTMFVFPKIVLTILFGAKYAIGSTVMQILSIGVIFFTIATIDQSILSGIGKPREVTIILLIAAIFNLIANIVLIPKWGMEAAAVTTTLSYILIAWLTLRSLSKFVEFKEKFIRWFQSLAAGLVFVLVVYIMKNLLTGNQYIITILSIFTASLAYLGACWFTGLLNVAEVKKLISAVFNKKISEL